MRNILVPTDFSKNADYALKAAVMMSRQSGAKLHLLNCQDLPPYWDNLPKEEKEKWDIVNIAQKHAEYELDQLQKQYPNVKISAKTSTCSLPDAVIKQINEAGIDLVVMGSHGAKGKSEFFIGSNTQKVVRSIHCPCLIIKNQLKDTNFKKIVFASSFNRSEMDSFLYFKSLVKHFIPEIHFVAIHTSIYDPPSPIQMEAMDIFKKACSPLVSFSHVYKDVSIDKGIRSFANDIGADLIAISYHERHPLKRMLIGSNVEALVNHAELPVLTIDFE